MFNSVETERLLPQHISPFKEKGRCYQALKSVHKFYKPILSILLVKKQYSGKVGNKIFY
jgi:hypothetical protein